MKYKTIHALLLELHHRLNGIFLPIKNVVKQFFHSKIARSTHKTLRRIIPQRMQTALRPYTKKRRVRIGIMAAVGVILLSEMYVVLQPLFIQHTYALGSAGSLLPAVNESLAKKLTYDANSQTFNFNNGQSLPSAESLQTGSQQVSAIAHKDPAKGVSVSDPVNKIDFSLTPKFSMLDGEQDGNRIVYPLTNGMGWSVYAMQATGVKEDIILTHTNSDEMTLDYTLGLGDGMIARLEADGGIGVYGNKLFSGSISTGSEKDAELLQKARKNSEKDTLLFTIPRPVIVEADKQQSDVKAVYLLNGDKLKVAVTGLEKAHYPLSIDPSIYVASAQQFMYGNNETNINFNVDNQLIEKGRTTGARFDTWNPTTNLPASSWGNGAVAAGGYIYSVGGISFNGQVYNTQGIDTFTVPADVTSITVKMWGGGGGGGGGGEIGNGSAGGVGGGAGYITGTIAVTPGEVLNVYVGGGGSGGTNPGGSNMAGGGGGGGGYSSLYRGSTPLTIAAGGAGAGGGGSRTGGIGGAGGAGGGATGVAGTTSGGAGGGGGGTQSAGGAAGSGGNNPGTAGSSLTGGLGGDGRTGAGADGSGAIGGLATGGDGGAPVNTERAGGGGGGGGYFGGGGGSGSARRTGAGGGGGGSSYAIIGATSVTNTAGSGATPANSADAFRNGAGQGGGAGGVGVAGSKGADGLTVITYGSGGTTATQSVNWAKFNTTNGTIDSANPGAGTCSGWCTTAAYNLPQARANFSLVAYNGFLYAFGGTNTADARQNTVYITKLGSNGEPQLWHPTDPNKTNWSYWYQDTNLSSVRAYTSAVAYNNRMYLIGGLSTSAAVSTVEVADINPNGKLGSWAASTSLPINLYGHSAQVYNDRLYVLGGTSSIGGALLNSVYYVKINSDGSLNNWIQTSSFNTGRKTGGGNFSVVWGGYLYISGGCSAVNASGYCTTVRSDTQVASINADGSLDVWNNMGGVTDQRMGASLIAWRDSIYEIGGCSAQNTTTGDCTTNMLNTINYGTINQDGDASTVDQSVASGTAPCSGGAPTSCNLPGSATVGNMLSAAVITNGYLYVIGGCTNNACSTTSNDVVYASISSTGIMTRPATCPGGVYVGGTWCNDTTNLLPNGIAATSPIVFGDRIYLVGGLSGSGNTNTILYTTANNDGSVGAWTSQSLTGLGAISVSYLFAYARSNPTAASTNPGNLYIFGGCTTSSSAGCTGYSQGVYKCNIQTSGAVAGCSTSGQQQIGIVPGDTQVGLGIMSGTVYANYIYLIGGVTPNQVDLATLRYAKFDNNNNVVSANGSGTWTESPNVMPTGRRRAAAFGYNGYIYVVGGYDGTSGSGVLADIVFIKVNVSDGSLGSASEGFKESAVTINQRWGLSVPVSNSFAYVIGGCTAGASPGSCTTRTDVVQTFQIYNNDSGAPAGYATSANTYTTSPNRIGVSSAILNGYIYAAGGCVSTTDCISASNNVSYAPIDANGAIGTWSAATGSLPDVRAWGKLETAGGTLYYIGGQSDTATDRRSEIYYTTPASGNVTSWNTASNGLPSGRTNFASAVWNNRLYVIGGEGTGTGCTGSNVCNTVYMSPQLTAGGNITNAWSTASTSINVARSGATAVAYANNLYVFGGFDGTNYLSDSQYSQLNTSTGTAGGWTYSTSLPGPLSQSEGFAANGYIYLVGGRSSTTICDPITLAAPISANTTIASGNNPTGIGEWYETNQRYTGARYGAAAVYNEGKAYVLGGGCGATLTYASPATQQTALLSQPQVAKYSIMVDTDSDVFPTSWLLNGLDNSIGANWQLKYRSMTSPTTSCTSPAMTAWGQETNFGNVTLGLPGVYTPKNSGGVSTNCARYYYFNTTVDSSQAFGYPDDVTRGPTITDLTLQFTADPSKRLMHGRTFTGGLQQPIDTPYYAQ
ncbi:MAG: hypothetical protein JWM07_416 [Candidatus Saccharibacteria bacterium]|nr:hypothetical protein [Candidatus Saccharibacteria bacterium]